MSNFLEPEETTAEAPACGAARGRFFRAGEVDGHTELMDAGYSGTLQLKKLGIIPGSSWSVSNASAGWSFEIEPDAAGRVPEGAPADVVLAFARSAAEIAPMLSRLESAIFPAGALWIAWPRKAAGHSSDITDNVVRDAALALRLVDVKVAALDADWSALKLVWRKEARH